MTRLTQTKLKGNIISDQESLARRMRRQEALPKATSSPLKYFQEVETGELYWDEVVTVRGELFPILRPVAAPEDVE